MASSVDRNQSPVFSGRPHSDSSAQGPRGRAQCAGHTVQYMEDAGSSGVMMTGAERTKAKFRESLPSHAEVGMEEAPSHVMTSYEMVEMYKEKAAEVDAINKKMQPLSCRIKRTDKLIYKKVLAGDAPMLNRLHEMRLEMLNRFSYLEDELDEAISERDIPGNWLIQKELETMGFNIPVERIQAVYAKYGRALNAVGNCLFS
jgi:hypothetical protein